MYISIILYIIQCEGNSDSEEICVLKILKTSINTKCKLICGCVYRHPFISLKLFNEHLSCVLGMLQRERKYVYITGDFNVNTLPIYNGGLARQDFINIF